MRAIKKISKSTLKYPLTFAHEIKILKKLDHPHIISIHETIEDSTDYYIVTE